MGFLSRFHKPSADDPPATESWPLFAFGKLPVYKDFISAGLTDDVSREFRDWLSNGFSRHWSSRDDCRSTEIPLHAFLLRLPESRKMAVGALWGSTDQGGLRKFPFALFTVLPAGKPVASVLTALDYLPVFESRAREIRGKYDAGGSLAAVYQELRGARIEIPVRKEEQIRLRLAEALAHSRIGSLATALFGKDAEKQWAALLAGLDAAARKPASGAAAFRLPLADAPVPLHQLKLWAVRLAKSSPAGAAPTGVLYRTGGAVPCGVIFFRDARAEDILLLHPEAIPTDFVEEIPKSGGRTASEAAVEPATAVDAPPTSVPPTSPPAINAPPTSAPATSAPATAPVAAAVTAPAETAPPAESVLPSEAAPPAGPPPGEEILLLGAAAPVAEVRPALLPSAPAGEVAPEVPAAPEKPAVPETPAVAEPPAAPAPAAPPPAAPAPAAPPPEAPPPAAPASAISGSAAFAPVISGPAAPAPVTAVPTASASDSSTPPESSPPVPQTRAEPAGWDLPLASLLEAG